MKTNSLISILALALTLCISAPHAAKAGGSTPTDTTASLKGVARFEGKVPSAKRVNMAADPSCANQHPPVLFAQPVVTDSQGKLQDVIVFVADGLGDRTFDLPAQPVVVEQKGCMYLPHVLAMRANQSLHLVNNDPTSHNIHATPENNREWNKAEPPGTSVEVAFAREEIAIPVRCNVHPWMHGYIAVFKHPFFAVTGKDGSFDLSGLPPGTYTIKAWHESLGTSSQTITLGANETKQISFVFKTM
jgi:plastocyanin